MIVIFIIVGSKEMLSIYHNINYILLYFKRVVK
jgi:hypothetical protein